MARGGYVTMDDLCGVLCGCGVAYALAADANTDEILRLWSTHLDKLATMVDEVTVARGLECLADHVRQTMPHATLKKKRRPSARH